MSESKVHKPVSEKPDKSFVPGGDKKKKIKLMGYKGDFNTICIYI